MYIYIYIYIWTCGGGREGEEEGARAGGGRRSASERRGNHLKDFKDFNLAAKARLSYMCQIQPAEAGGSERKRQRGRDLICKH